MLKPRAVLWIVVVSLGVIVLINYLIKRNKEANSGSRLYCGGSDSHGHNMYTGQPCQTSTSGSYSVSSGGNGIWAFGNNGCYCNTNAIHTQPEETPDNITILTPSMLENIAAGTEPTGPGRNATASAGANMNMPK